MGACLGLGRGVDNGRVWTQDHECLLACKGGADTKPMYPRWSRVLSFIGTCLETLQKKFPELFGELFLQRFEARDCHYFVASDLAD